MTTHHETMSNEGHKEFQSIWSVKGKDDSGRITYAFRVLAVDHDHALSAAQECFRGIVFKVTKIDSAQEMLCASAISNDLPEGR